MKNCAEEAGAGGPRVGNSEKLAASVVGRIEADIMASGWRVGEVIGTFAQLIDRYDASRAVLREAVGLLEHKKIVRMKHGPGGGVEVRAPVGAAVVDALGSYFDFTGVTDRELDELRAVLFGLAARLATQKLDDKGIAQLRTLLDLESKIEPSSPQTIAQYVDFYTLIGSFSRNPALGIFLPATSLRPFDYTTDLESTSEVHCFILEGHKRIADAMFARDADAAEALITEHLRSTSHILATAAEASDSVVFPLQTPATTIALDGEGKLPVRVARFIKREILEKGLRPGDVVGFERDLLESFDVSRSVFREAVRVVEYYGLAKMRRGPKGGLTVCEPDPKQMEDTIVTYLEYMGMDFDRLLEVRAALEVMNVRGAIDAGGAAVDRLRDVMDERHVQNGELRPLGLHRALSELSGNRASAFISNVIKTLMDNHLDLRRGRQQADPIELNAWTLRSDREHEEIFEAVQRRDQMLASERMVDHLEFFSTVLKQIDTKS